MTSRERVIAAIERQPLDRIPRYDGFWEDAIDRWIGEGLRLPEPKTIVVNGETKVIDSPVAECFGFDIAPLYMDISMRFPTGLVADDGVKITVADRCGYTAQKFKGRASSMHFISHMVEDEDDWEKYKDRLTLDPNDTARVDCESYYLTPKSIPPGMASWKSSMPTGNWISLSLLMSMAPGKLPGGIMAMKTA